MSSTTQEISNIRISCFDCGETVKDIFSVVIDKNLTINNLEAKIKTVWRDLQEIKIDLYKKDFDQDNNALVSTVNLKKDRGIN